MWEILEIFLLPMALKTCPKSNKSPNLVTLGMTSRNGNEIAIYSYSQYAVILSKVRAMRKNAYSLDF